jgi:membrane protein implicated in regulation of membrane protease activity
VFDVLTVEIFFIISLVIFLVLVELTAPFAVTPNWRTRLKWLIFLGLLAFSYIMVKRVLEYIPPGVF